MDEARRRLAELAGTLPIREFANTELGRAFQQAVGPATRDAQRLFALYEEEERIRKMVALSTGTSAIGHTLEAYARMQARMEQDEALFRNYILPQTTQIEALLKTCATFSETYEEFARHCMPHSLAGQFSTSVSATLEQMHAAWLNEADPLRSVMGLSGLQAIGGALGVLKPFGDEAADFFRRELGDWRDPITFPKAVFVDPAARSDFYASQGLNVALVEFPDDAFFEGTLLTGLHDGEPEVIRVFAPPVPSEEQPLLDVVAEVFRWLHALESQLRKFIDDVMTAAYGADWPRHRLPPNKYDEWQFKKKKAEGQGAGPVPLICYADFTDYVDIICRGDDFRNIFSAYFNRKEEVRESFQRLYPIRLATMHGRYVTREDQLYVFAEVTRLSKAWRSF